ncbi:MAG: hypothetical protein HPY67_13430 [Syntrophaceae bacterium]|nr:hypothetical protein [Syntrophaceae bacterium]
MTPGVQFPTHLRPADEPVLQIRTGQPPPGMSPGQTVEVRVLERLADGRLLIRAGETHLTAEAAPALRPGQTLTARVESLLPRVVLSVVPSAEERLIAEQLRAFRSNPAALTQSLAELAAVLGGRTGGAAPQAGPDFLAAILDALRAVLPGRERIGEGFSLTDFARTLGLLTESDLRRILEKPGDRQTSLPANLKTSLMRGLRELQAVPGTGEPAPVETGTARPLIPALEKALRAIEGRQLLDVHLQQGEGKLLFQVPLLMAGHVGNASILIERDGQRALPGGRGGAFRVLFALEMDALGDVMAQAHFSANTVTCSVHCAGADAASFVAGLLPALNDQLVRAGYRVAGLEVLVDRRVRETMQDRLREAICGDGAVLSVFA